MSHDPTLRKDKPNALEASLIPRLGKSHRSLSEETTEQWLRRYNIPNPNLNSNNKPEGLRQLGPFYSRDHGLVSYSTVTCLFTGMHGAYSDAPPPTKSAPSPTNPPAASAGPDARTTPTLDQCTPIAAILHQRVHEEGFLRVFEKSCMQGWVVIVTLKKTVQSRIGWIKLPASATSFCTGTDISQLCAGLLQLLRRKQTSLCRS